MQTTNLIDAKEAFTLSWEEMISIYEYLEVDSACLDEVEFPLFERLQNELKPRNVIEG